MRATGLRGGRSEHASQQGSLIDMDKPDRGGRSEHAGQQGSLIDVDKPDPHLGAVLAFSIAADRALLLRLPGDPR